MGRLIDADALKKAFEDTVCIEPMPYAFVKQIIDNAPTVEQYTEKELEERDADAFETGYIKGLCDQRPHGEWLDKGIAIQCSQCGAMYSISFYEKCYEHLLLNFCPNCGADNREVSNDG